MALAASPADVHAAGPLGKGVHPPRDSSPVDKPSEPPGAQGGGKSGVCEPQGTGVGVAMATRRPRHDYWYMAPCQPQPGTVIVGLGPTPLWRGLGALKEATPSLLYTLLTSGVTFGHHCSMSLTARRTTPQRARCRKETSLQGMGTSCFAE